MAAGGAGRAKTPSRFSSPGAEGRQRNPELERSSLLFFREAGAAADARRAVPPSSAAEEAGCDSRAGPVQRSKKEEREREDVEKFGN